MEIDWKKQYEEVLAKARAGKNLGEIFPELKEIEDGKIREEIVSFIRAFWVDHRYSVPQTSKWLAWLEKQKDSPMPEDTVVFQKGVAEGRRLEREDNKREWSEEDIQYYNAVMEMVMYSLYLPSRPRNEVIKWLKSLKNRGNFPKSNTNSPSWKPSDEQMGLFGRIVNDLKIKMVGVTIKEHHTLESLYNDLTKLL